MPRTPDALLFPPMLPSEVADELAKHLLLGSLLNDVRERWSEYQLVAHWQQGEFHHDVVLRVPKAAATMGGEILIASTNCNGGVKEVLCFASVPDRAALWHARCPGNPEFSGSTPDAIAAARTQHWFDPCVLLSPDARSELREEFRERQCGGGWVPKKALR